MKLETIRTAHIFFADGSIEFKAISMASSTLAASRFLAIARELSAEKGVQIVRIKMRICDGSGELKVA